MGCVPLFSPQLLWSASVGKPKKPASEFSSHVRYMNIDSRTNASKNVSFDLHTPVMEGLRDTEISADINDHPTIKGPCQSRRCHREMKVTGNNNQVYFIILSNQKGDDELKWGRKKKSEMHVKSPPHPNLSHHHLFCTLIYFNLSCFAPPSTGEAGGSGERWGEKLVSPFAS